MLLRLLYDKKGIDQILSFIVLVPLLLIIFVSVAQLVVIGHAQIVVQEAAFEGARGAAQHPDTIEESAKQYSRNFAINFLKDWDTKSSIDVEYPDTNPGSEVTVTIHYDYYKFGLFYNMLHLPKDDYVQGKSRQIIEEKP